MSNLIILTLTKSEAKVLDYALTTSSPIPKMRPPLTSTEQDVLREFTNIVEKLRIARSK